MKRALIMFLMFCMLCLIGITLEAKAASNQSYNWYFKREEGKVTTEPEYEALLKKYNGYYIGDRKKKVIYLTFDNGYENGYTKDILRVLKKEKVPAAFFITGHYLKEEPELVKQMLKEGHIVGSHSYKHPDYPTLSDAAIKEDLEQLEQAFTALTGKEKLTYLRAPRGVFSERTLAITNEAGYTNVFWSLAYKDWETHVQRGPDYAYDKIMKQIHPGAVLLLHSVSKDNAEALQSVIQSLKKQGYTFGDLDQLTKRKKLPL